MLVKRLLKKMDREIITTTADTDVCEAMGVLIDNRISCLPVLKSGGKLEGIVSDKDIFKLIFEHRADHCKFKVRDVMTTDLLVGLVDDDVNYIAGLMTENHVRHIPIVKKDKLVGLVSQSDVVKAQMKSIAVENRYLKLYINGDYPS